MNTYSVRYIGEAVVMANSESEAKSKCLDDEDVLCNDLEITSIEFDDDISEEE